MCGSHSIVLECERIRISSPSLPGRTCNWENVLFCCWWCQMREVLKEPSLETRQPCLPGQRSYPVCSQEIPSLSKPWRGRVRGSLAETSHNNPVGCSTSLAVGSLCCSFESAWQEEGHWSLSPAAKSPDLFSSLFSKDLWGVIYCWVYGWSLY